ncbi:molybdopterin binding aldehyde oxidase/xanthine dehydrogenase [Mortierella sp. GBAus27b]|nr:molybdopterin binding aldehyde oxidase/xanthine dehydrogenase [Mortierella sp. GBAus27b]
MAPIFDLSGYSNTLNFYLNGTEISIENPDPDTTLLQYVRSIGLTGSKLGCAEGGCGACTVLVSSYDKATQHIQHLNVNGCLTPLCSVDGKHVITIEGLGTYKNPHPVQERIALCFGSQCGFCTPGIAMSLYALLRNNPKPTEEEIEESFDGNLCRCTGYRPILDAAKSFAVPKAQLKNGSVSNGTAINGTSANGTSANGASSNGCCGNGGPNGCCRAFDRPTVPKENSPNFPSVLFKKYDPTQELIFPPRLMKKTPQPLHFQGRKTQWFRPTTLEQVLRIKATFPTAKFVGGNTEVGIETKFKHFAYSPLVYLHDVAELRGISITSDGITIGANVTIADFQKALEQALETVDIHQGRVLRAFLANIKYFAGHQIRNSASVAGNVATASPISDLNPVFIASNAIFSILSSSQTADAPAREIPATEFFVGYRKTALDPESDILTRIHIPFTRPGESIRAFKQSKRRDDDIAIVAAAIRVRLSPESKIEEIVFGYGGMAAFTCQAKKTSEYLKDKTWGDKDVLEKALETLDEDLPMQISTPGGMAEYRRTLAKSFFVRFWWDVIQQQNMNVQHEHGDLRMMTEEIHRHVSFGSQSDKGTTQNSETKIVSKSASAVSAVKQTTGEAIFTDDMPGLQNELYAALVLSTRSHAKVVSVDTSAALEHTGVRGYVDHRDVPGLNVFSGGILDDEFFFVTDTVHCVGQIIGVILADTQAIAQEASRMVKVEYTDLPPLVTIDEAIAANSYIPLSRTLVKGDVDAAFATCAKIFEGETRIGGQEHFYLETQAAIVNYKGEDEVEIYSSTQSPKDMQMCVAKLLGLRAHKVTCKVKRIGGGFGGKETRTIPMAGALAVASYRTKRPIRCMLDRNEDMVISGQRNPFLGRWKVGLDENNKFVALDVKMYLNSGWSADLSPAVIERAILQIDGVYNFHNVRLAGYNCRTNLPSNTSFRGFGSPQANLITENILCQVAEQINMPVDDFRVLNFYKAGELTHHNQELLDWHLPKGYQQLKEKSNYEARVEAVKEFNKMSKWRKRGIAFIPTKYGIAFAIQHLNQGGALIHIYHDGSVLLSHGGVEMGQGLHTKMIQVCSEGLQIPMELIHTVDVSTDRVANTTSTAASASSDINGMAIQDACNQLNERLAPYRSKGLSWTEIVHHAYFDRVNLSANGFCKIPDVCYDFDTNTGQVFSYFTMGAAISEVEVDILTGTHTILRSDVNMDLGRSLNPGIDIGQIEGAFMQGVGLTTTEEPLWFPDGRVFTQGPSTYKIPGFRCIPQEFNISFFEDVTHDSVKSIYKSKGVGEPPLFLGSSVYFAIRDALRYARKDNGHEETFALPIPATAEKIRMAVGDSIALSSKLVAKPGERPWILQSC